MTWEALYQQNKHQSVWPWTDVVSLIKRFCMPTHSDPLHVLELGCGMGANIGFFQALGWHYTGIDGSKTAITALQQHYPMLKDRLWVGDFTQILGKETTAYYDLILDRSSITFNSTAGIENTLAMVHRALKPGGFLVGVDWYSQAHSAFASAQTLQNDPYTACDVMQGHLTGTGQVHFSSQEHLEALLKNFQWICLESKQAKRLLPKQTEETVATWNFIVQKAKD